MDIGIEHKNTLKGKYLDSFDDMLIKLFYVYERSPKKYRELSELVAVFAI